MVVRQVNTFLIYDTQGVIFLSLNLNVLAAVVYSVHVRVYIYYNYIQFVFDLSTRVHFQ